MARRVRGGAGAVGARQDSTRTLAHAGAALTTAEAARRRSVVHSYRPCAREARWPRDLEGARWRG
eukprot:scaffold26692_cov66-Phaeocystis_antarctica.AAC.1